MAVAQEREDAMLRSATQFLQRKRGSAVAADGGRDGGGDDSGGNAGRDGGGGGGGDRDGDRGDGGGGGAGGGLGGSGDGGGVCAGEGGDRREGGGDDATGEGEVRRSLPGLVAEQAALRTAPRATDPLPSRVRLQRISEGASRVLAERYAALAEGRASSLAERAGSVESSGTGYVRWGPVVVEPVNTVMNSHGGEETLSGNYFEGTLLW